MTDMIPQVNEALQSVFGEAALYLPTALGSHPLGAGPGLNLMPMGGDWPAARALVLYVIGAISSQWVVKRGESIVCRIRQSRAMPWAAKKSVSRPKMRLRVSTIAIRRLWQ